MNAKHRDSGVSHGIHSDRLVNSQLDPEHHVIIVPATEAAFPI
jgi:hypothetical protein